MHSQTDATKLQRFEMQAHAEPVVVGSAVGARIGAGRVQVILHSADISTFQPGNVLVTEMTDPDWEPVLKQASAVVTNRGGRTCHAAIISRELGIPCIVGCGDATSRLADGDEVTVDCSAGDEGRVYPGVLAFRVTETDLGTIPVPRTHVMMNLANPQLAFQKSFIPNAGVGLARMEFIVSNHIKCVAVAVAVAVSESVAARGVTASRAHWAPTTLLLRAPTQGTPAGAVGPQPRQPRRPGCHRRAHRRL